MHNYLKDGDVKFLLCAVRKGFDKMSWLWVFEYVVSELLGLPTVWNSWCLYLWLAHLGVSSFSQSLLSVSFLQRSGEESKFHIFFSFYMQVFTKSFNMILCDRFLIILLPVQWTSKDYAEYQQEDDAKSKEWCNGNFFGIHFISLGVLGFFHNFKFK